MAWSDVILGEGHLESAATLTSGLSLKPSCGWERETLGHLPRNPEG